MIYARGDIFILPSIMGMLWIRQGDCKSQIASRSAVLRQQRASKTDAENNVIDARAAFARAERAAA